MKKGVTKNMTIDDLAIMVAKGFGSVDSRFDKIDLRFDKVEGRLDKVEGRLDKVEKGMKELDDTVKATRRDVLEIGDRFVSRFEFDNLLARFSRLEQKIKDRVK